MNQCTFEVQRKKYVADPELSTDTKFKIINETIEKYFKLPIYSLCGPSRKTEYVIPRHIALSLHYANCFSYPIKYIGKFFGGRDHATVIHSFETVRDKVNSPFDDELKRCYNEVVKLLPFDPKPLQYRYARMF